VQCSGVECSVVEWSLVGEEMCSSENVCMWVYGYILIEIWEYACAYACAVLWVAEL
jgi:hypothetical protein